MTTPKRDEVMNELHKMFQAIDVGYDKKHDRFTGLIVMPDGRFGQAAQAIRSAIAQELDGMKIKGYRYDKGSSSHNFQLGYNQAITEAQEKIRRGE